MFGSLSEALSTDLGVREADIVVMLLLWGHRWRGGGLAARFRSLSEAVSTDLESLVAYGTWTPTRFARISPSRARRPDGSRRLTG